MRIYQSAFVLVIMTGVAMLQKTSPQVFLSPGTPDGTEIFLHKKLQLSLIGTD